ncbi:hypothetical protein BGZ70_005410, partial [Mortierella alpina]
IQQAELPQYINPISPATFRDVPRKYQARGREDDSALTGPVLKRAFARAFNDFVEEQIVKGMAPIMKRQRFKRGETRESKLAELKDAMRLDLESRDQVPRGSYAKVIDIARSEHGLSSGYRPQQLRRTVEAQITPMDGWKEALRRYNSIWTRVEKRLGKKAQPSDVSPEKSEDAQKELRTCTITLSSILRPDLEEQQETVVRLLSEAQEKITDVVMYLAITAQKLYLLLSEGKLYERSTMRRPKSLEQAPSQPKSKQSDIARFFSQGHLQFMFTRLMGTQQAARDVQEVVDDKDDAEDNPHALWERGLQLVKRASDLSQVPEPSPGLSHTITEAIRELSTALGNMWDGRMYNKVLRYLCRIALRLQLAPKIDRNVKAWKKRAASRKQDQQQKRATRTALTKKQWKKRIKELFDSLADLLQEQSTAPRIEEICKAIADLEEPQSSQHRILSIEERLNESGSSAVTDVESDAEGA